MEKKIQVVREASRHACPSGGIERMLEEIERGSLDRGFDDVPGVVRLS